MERPQKQLTLSEIGRDLADEFLSLDRGLPYTFARLFVAPGATMRRWLEDRDPRITRPVRYLLVATTVLAAVAYLLRGRYDALEFIARNPNAVQASRLAAEHLLLTKLASVAVGALLLWLVYRRRSTTFVEAIVVSAYAGAQVMWINAAFLLLLAPTRSLLWVMLVGGVAALGYNVWAWGDYFGRRLRDFGLALLVLVLTQWVIVGIGLAATRIAGIAD